MMSTFRQTNFRKLSASPTFLQGLKQEIRVDPLPAAVLWVETSLRPSWLRIVEYMFWKMCETIATKRAAQITVGLAQMKVWLWKEFLKSEFGRTPSIADWENPMVNFYAVRWYLSRNVEVHSLLDISRIYTGQVNRYYAGLLDEALALLEV